MEQRCYTGSHLTAIWAIGIPGVVLLCIGAPLAPRKPSPKVHVGGLNTKHWLHTCLPQSFADAHLSATPVLQWAPLAAASNRCWDGHVHRAVQR
jgi:hypothetical protein